MIAKEFGNIPKVTLSNLRSFISYNLDSVDSYQLLQKESFCLPHFQVNIHTNNNAFLNYCKNSFALLPNNTAPLKQLDIYICSADKADILVPPKWGDDKYLPIEIERVLAGTGLNASYFHDDNLWHLFNSDENIGLQWMQGSDAYPPWEMSAPARVFLHWAYSEKENTGLVHAGTLGKGGKGILLTGKGGSGKSGTVVSGILNEMQSVGDDYVLLEKNQNQINAKPLYKIMKQDQSGAERLDLRQKFTHEKTINWQGKYEFTAEEIAGIPFAEKLNIKALFVPAVTNQKKSEIQPISKMDAMLALAPSSIYQLPGNRAKNALFCASIVRDLPCFEIKLSSNSAEISDCIAKFIGDLDG